MEKIYHPDISNNKNILLFIENENFERSIKNALLTANYTVMPVLITDNTLQSLPNNEPTAIVLDVDSITQHHIVLLNTIQRVMPCPMLIFVEYPTNEMIQSVLNAKLNAYIVADRMPHHVEPTLNIAIARFNEVAHLQAELDDVKSKLENRKWLDKAKGMIMEQKGLTENEAHKMIRKMAMDKGKKMDIVAKDLVEYMQAFG